MAHAPQLQRLTEHRFGSQIHFSESEVHMRSLHRMAIIWALLLGLVVALNGQTQQRNDPNDQEANTSSRTMRPVIRGRQYAATSMKAEATQAAEHILQAGGNAFDAIVA